MNMFFLFIASFTITIFFICTLGGYTFSMFWDALDIGFEKLEGIRMVWMVFVMLAIVVLCLVERCRRKC